jgi:hypothetical protein
MPTIVFKKEEFLKQIGEIIGEDEYVIYSSDVHGTVSAPTKKTPAKLIPFAFNKSAFGDQESINDIMRRAKLGGLVIMHFDDLSPEMQDKINKEENEEEKTEG